MPRPARRRSRAPVSLIPRQERHVVTRSVSRPARAVMQALPRPAGAELFQYLDDDGQPQDRFGRRERLPPRGRRRGLHRRRISGPGAQALYACGRSPRGTTSFPCRRRSARSRRLMREVAGALGNARPPVCRASYVHPALLEAYSEGELPPAQPGRRLRGLGLRECAGSCASSEKLLPGRGSMSARRVLTRSHMFRRGPDG